MVGWSPRSPSVAVPWQAEVDESECVGVYGWMDGWVDVCVCVWVGAGARGATDRQNLRPLTTGTSG